MVNPLDLKYLKNIEGGIGLVELTKNINSDDYAQSKGKDIAMRILQNTFNFNYILFAMHRIYPPTF